MQMWAVQAGAHGAASSGGGRVQGALVLCVAVAGVLGEVSAAGGRSLWRAGAAIRGWHRAGPAQPPQRQVRHRTTHRHPGPAFLVPAHALNCACASISLYGSPHNTSLDPLLLA